MSVTSLAVVQAKTWPRSWPDQERLLERQHDAIEAALRDLVFDHRPQQPAWSEEQHGIGDAACRRLIRDLQLHLRLEERWLSQQGCLCLGHRRAHRDAASAAVAGLRSTAGDCQARWTWLRDLQTWFNAHRNGPDAMAYALATSTQHAKP